MRTKPGEIWMADLGMVAKTRPILIVSREDNDPPRALIIQVPLTTQNRGSEYEVDLGRLPFLRESSVANVQGLQSTPITRLEYKLGQLPSEQYEKVKTALRIALDL
jgi:mRNA interferase MazF